MYILKDCVVLKQFSNTKKENTFGLETDDESKLFSVENKEGYPVTIIILLYFTQSFSFKLLSPLLSTLHAISLIYRDIQTG